WTVRAALATVLGSLPPETALARLNQMIADEDQRVISSVLTALVALHDPPAPDILFERLRADAPAVRAAAASGIGELKPPRGAQALGDAYKAAERDPTYAARAAALAAIVKYGEA